MVGVVVVATVGLLKTNVTVAVIICVMVMLEYICVVVVIDLIVKRLLFV
jgi:hypothetical protein